ncbi:MAG: TIGR02453 family protein [Cryomorphaceae bacterium]|nr:TIGR02453 family protein [Cryomorphaceae bacterium]
MSATMTYLTNDFIDFFKELEENNNRDWFQLSKSRYEKSVKVPFQKLIGDVIKSFKEAGEPLNIEPKDAIFRINRDVRFSKNKAPYKTNVAAIISPEGRKDKEVPGFYIQASANSIWLGGGAYALEKENLYMVREFIKLNPERYKKLISDKNFIKHYGEIKGEKNKILAPEFREIAADIPDIFNKQFYYMAELPAKELISDKLLTTIMDYRNASLGMQQFLTEAILRG